MVFVCGLLPGCVSSHTDRLPTETRFRELHTPADLAGSFRNQGNSPGDGWHPLLSDILFPPAVLSETPTQIRLSSTAPSVLCCEAILRGTVLPVRDLREGPDFRFVAGRIRLVGTLGESGLLEGGLGVSTEVSRIGLTEGGAVVVSSDRHGAGLMLLVVPMAITVSEEAVFERITESATIAE